MRRVRRGGLLGAWRVKGRGKGKWLGGDGIGSRRWCKLWSRSWDLFEVWSGLTGGLSLLLGQARKGRGWIWWMLFSFCLRLGFSPCWRLDQDNPGQDNAVLVVTAPRIRQGAGFWHNLRCRRWRWGYLAYSSITGLFCSILPLLAGNFVDDTSFFCLSHMCRIPSSIA